MALAAAASSRRLLSAPALGAAAARLLRNPTARRPAERLLQAAFPQQRSYSSIPGGGRAGAPPPGFWAHLGVAMVPQKHAWVVERFGRFREVLEPGLHFLIPIVDRVAYTHLLKEEPIPIDQQHAITKDNVTIAVDSVLYLKIMDAEQERGNINAAIKQVVNDAAKAWGLKVIRHEIRDIVPPASIKKAMEMQAEAERRRRGDVLESEGDQVKEVNLAQGRSDAEILRAKGEAEAIKERSKATAEGIRELSSAITSQGGENGAALRVAELWVAAWRDMGRQSNTIIVPANAGDPSAMVGTAMGILQNMKKPDANSAAAGHLPDFCGRPLGRQQPLGRAEATCPSFVDVYLEGSSHSTLGLEELLMSGEQGSSLLSRGEGAEFRSNTSDNNSMLEG